MLADLETRLVGRTELAARLARDTLARVVRDLTAASGPIEREIEGIVAVLAPTLRALPRLRSVGRRQDRGLTAGMTRIRSKEAFARQNESAPVPDWQRKVARFRLSRGGNRQLNQALHRIAITQIRIRRAVAGRSGSGGH